MKRKESTVLPLHDYRHALQGALSWLGDRYLLAEPARRLKDDRSSFFAEPRRWHPTVVVNTLAKTSR